MTIKEYLSQAFALDRLLKSRRIQIEELRAMQTSIGPRLYGDKVQSTPKHDRTADITVKLLDMITEYERDIERLLEVKTEIKHMIEHVNRIDYRLLLSLRYESLMTFEQIAVEMNYSWRQVMRKHRKAIDVIECHMA